MTHDPGVRLIVDDHAVRTATGFGVIEGHHDPVPLTVIDRALCDGYLPLQFDDEGRCLDLGREKRLFSKRQKIALALRDGGCIDPDCDRPPSWTEAHHIDHWLRDGGRTDLADGILLCRRDHLRYHNQGWEIRREGADYWLIPPPTIDPDQTPRHMRSKTRAEVLNPVVLDARHRAAATYADRGGGEGDSSWFENAASNDADGRGQMSERMNSHGLGVAPSQAAPCRRPPIRSRSDRCSPIESRARNELLPTARRRARCDGTPSRGAGRPRQARAEQAALAIQRQGDVFMWTW